jgi:hypothetical protein
MPPQNTHSPALREVLDHWRELTRAADPIVRAAARELIADLKQTRRPQTELDARPPAGWRSVIAQVINTEPRYSATSAGYKTGHGYAHGSKSGTCVSVNTERGIWYCSSCRRGGTTITWVMDIEQCSYGQAWQVLVDRFGAEHA